MKQTQRHNGIIELVKQQGYVSTEELVEHFPSARRLFAATSMSWRSKT